MANGYGVLGSDRSPREKTVNFDQEIESRLVIPSPRGDSSALTLVTRLRKDGVYEFFVEDENRVSVKHVEGNVIGETQK